jgi:hypothetical protein
VQSSLYTASFGPGGLNAVICLSMHRNDGTNSLDEYLLGKIALQHIKSSSCSTRVYDNELQRPSGPEELVESYDAKV